MGGVVGQMMRLRLVICIGALALSACAPRPVAQRAEPSPEARIEPVFVVAQRQLNETGSQYGKRRAPGLHYFRADVSVPPVHQPGKIEWPRDTPNATKHFVIANTVFYGKAPAFVQDAHRATPERETLVFVHGYNNTLSESLYRLAQIQADFDTGGPAVLFSWPSAGDPRGYIYDRDSVLFSRDALEQTLRDLTNAPGEKVFLLAHSVGSELVMEVLRQAAIRGDHRLLGRISGVVLMSPDIDPDVFRAQAKAIGKLPQPFMIFISRQDKALSFMSFLTGSKPRLGRLTRPEDLQGLEVSVVDFTALADGEGYDHFVPVTSPAAITALNRLIERGARRGIGAAKYIVLQAQP